MQIPPEINLREHPPVPPPGFRDDFASQDFPAPLSVVNAQKILMRTKTFAISFNAMHHWPRQLQAFNRIMDQPDRHERFELIYREGQMAGKLYSLCAFQVIDPGRGTAMTADLKKSGLLVDTIDGDVLDEVKAGDLVDKIGKQRLGKEFRNLRDLVYASFKSAG